MELKKANLHMDRVKCQINTQITLEEDKNISDRNPDADRILMESGRVVIEELRPATDSLAMKGKLEYEVLYSSDEENGRLYRIQGEIPWEEKIRVDGMENIDNPQVQANIEDLRSSLINSRKINIRGLVNFCIRAKEIRDDEILLDIEDAGNMEIKKEPYSQSVIVADKKDIFRIKEDLELPSSLPPIGEVLWKYLDLGKWEIKPLEDNIGIQGEVRLFILYESAEEQPQIKAYETTIPFSGNIECPGTNSCMVADITPQISFSNLSVKQDYDGEDRMIDVEMVLDIPIQIYDQRQMEQVTDIYATATDYDPRSEMTKMFFATVQNKLHYAVLENTAAEVIYNRVDNSPEYSSGTCRLMRDKYQGKIKVAETLKLPASSGKILQICHMNAFASLEDSRLENDGLAMDGILTVAVLYITDNEHRKYEVMKKEIPFSYEMDNLNLSEKCKWKINLMIEQCNSVILDESSIEVKVVIYLDIMIEEVKERISVTNVRIRPYDEETINNTPGMVVYIPSKRENVWSVGKRYCVSQESIREINQLTGNEIERGQKILLVKGMC